MPRKFSKLYAFLDTNIFLEYEEFSQLNWPKLLDAEAVCLVVAPMVRREIEGYRTDPRSPRRQKRARSLSGKLRDLVLSVDDGFEADVTGHPHVSLLELSQSPVLDRYPYLQPHVQDDHIIASLLDFRAAHPDRAVMLVAGDTGLVLKARSRGIPYRYLENEYRLPDEPNPDHKRIRDLERKIELLEQTHPNLKVNLKGATEGVLTLPLVAQPHALERFERVRLLKALDALEEYRCRKEKGQGEFSAVMLGFIERMRNWAPTEVDSMLLAELKSGLRAFGIEGFDKRVLEPTDVWLEPNLVSFVPGNTHRITGPGADWYRAVLELRENLREAHRRVHNVRRNAQYKRLTISVENIGTVTANELEITVTTPDGEFNLLSSLDVWYLHDPNAYPYMVTDIYGRELFKEWRKHDFSPELELRARAEAVRPGDSFEDDLGYIRVPDPDEKVELRIRIVGRNLPQSLEVEFFVRAA